MRVIFAADHAGFDLKEALKAYVALLGHTVEDTGANALDMNDDYVGFVKAAARIVSEDPYARAVVIGGSGQGEAMVANRFKGVRAAVYYGEPPRPQKDAEGNVLDMMSSVRGHNDSNVLSLGARFLSGEDAKNAVKKWLDTPFSGAERHARRIKAIDAV